MRYVGDKAPEEPFLTSGEVAKRLGVTSRAVAKWVEQGKLVPAVITPGHRYRFRWSEVQQQLRALQQRDE